MITTKNTIFNVKHFSGKSRIFSNFPLLLYINRNPTLPSLCKALHNDGWGEGLEQREIKTADYGEVYVSFWNSSDNWSMQTEEMEFEQSEDLSEEMSMTM